MGTLVRENGLGRSRTVQDETDGCPGKGMALSIPKTGDFLHTPELSTEERFPRS
jgi:hypothetical protein